MDALQHKHNFALTPGQKQKLRTAYKKRRPAILGLKRDQLSGGRDQILLSSAQHRALQSAGKANRGLRLVLSYEQLTKNKNGGLLKEMLGMVEQLPLVGKSVVAPLVRKKLAPLLRDHFIPWLKHLVDSELDTIIDRDPRGAGLKRRINAKLNSLLSANKKSPFVSSPCRLATLNASRAH